MEESNVVIDDHERKTHEEDALPTPISLEEEVVETSSSHQSPPHSDHARNEDEVQTHPRNSRITKDHSPSIIIGDPSEGVRNRKQLEPFVLHLYD